MAYQATYSPSQVAGMPADIIGTAGVAVKGFVPLFVMGAVGYGLAKRGKKAVKKWKKTGKARPRKSARSAPKMSRSSMRKKFGWGFYI